MIPVMFIHRILRILLAAGIALAAYFLLYRPLQLHWGATAAEIAMPLPGDEVVTEPDFNATRAVTIAATPDTIWPWIVQIGHTRAGWYSYDLIDNLGRLSAASILPQFQQVQPGDIIPISPDGQQGFYVKEYVPNEYMLWWDKTGGMTFAWALLPIDAQHTRLVTRIRMDYDWQSPAILFDLAIDAGDLPMMRQSMLGIRDRAEGRPVRPVWHQSLELLLWIAAFGVFVAAEIRLLRAPAWTTPAVLAVTAAGGTILLVVLQPPLWGTTLGAALLAAAFFLTRTKG